MTYDMIYNYGTHIVTVLTIAATAVAMRFGAGHSERCISKCDDAPDLECGLGLSVIFINTECHGYNCGNVEPVTSAWSFAMTLFHGIQSVVRDAVAFGQDAYTSIQKSTQRAYGPDSVANALYLEDDDNELIELVVDEASIASCSNAHDSVALHANSKDSTSDVVLPQGNFKSTELTEAEEETFEASTDDSADPHAGSSSSVTFADGLKPDGSKLTLADLCDDTDIQKTLVRSPEKENWISVNDETSAVCSNHDSEHCDSVLRKLERLRTLSNAEASAARRRCDGDFGEMMMRGLKKLDAFSSKDVDARSEHRHGDIDERDAIVKALEQLDAFSSANDEASVVCASGRDSDYIDEFLKDLEQLDALGDAQDSALRCRHRGSEYCDAMVRELERLYALSSAEDSAVHRHRDSEHCDTMVRVQQRFAALGSAQASVLSRHCDGGKLTLADLCDGLVGDADGVRRQLSNEQPQLAGLSSCVAFSYDLEAITARFQEMGSEESGYESSDDEEDDGDSDCSEYALKMLEGLGTLSSTNDEARGEHLHDGSDGEDDGYSDCSEGIPEMLERLGGLRSASDEAHTEHREEVVEELEPRDGVSSMNNDARSEHHHDDINERDAIVKALEQHGAQDDTNGKAHHFSQFGYQHQVALTPINGSSTKQHAPSSGRRRQPRRRWNRRSKKLTSPPPAKTLLEQKKQEAPRSRRRRCTRDTRLRDEAPRYDTRNSPAMFVYFSDSSDTTSHALLLLVCGTHTAFCVLCFVLCVVHMMFRRQGRRRRRRRRSLSIPYQALEC